MKKETDSQSSLIGLIFGIQSIVFAFFSAPVGIVFGIIGLFFSKSYKRAQLLNALGIIISVIVIIIAYIFLSKEIYTY